MDETQETKASSKLEARSKLEVMSKSELFRYAESVNVVDIPASYRKDEIIDVIMEFTGRPVSEQAVDATVDLRSDAEQADNEPEPEKQPHEIEHEKETAVLEKLVALAAAEWGMKDVAVKASKKTFERLRDQLIEHLAAESEPTLFDGDDENQRCRVCKCEQSMDKKFVADDLCQVCADNLGKEQDSTNEEKEATSGD